MIFGEAMALPEARKRAQRADVTVNGLAILSDVPLLDTYYKRKVISGPGSFVISAANFEDFRRAFRIKLLREIRVLVGEEESPIRVAER